MTGRGYISVRGKRDDSGVVNPSLMLMLEGAGKGRREEGKGEGRRERG